MKKCLQFIKVRVLSSVELVHAHCATTIHARLGVMLTGQLKVGVL